MDGLIQELDERRNRRKRNRAMAMAIAGAMANVCKEDPEYQREAKIFDFLKVTAECKATLEDVMDVYGFYEPDDDTSGLSEEQMDRAIKLIEQTNDNLKELLSEVEHKEED